MITPAIQPTIVPAQPQRIELQKLMVKRGDQQQLKVKEVQQKFPLKQDTFTTKPTRFPKPPSIDRQKKLTSQPLLHRSIQTKLITPMLQEEDREQQFSNNNVSQNGRQQPVTQAPPVTKQFEGRSQRNQEVLQLISHPKQVKQQNIQLPKQLSTESHLTYTHQVREQQQTTPLSPTRSQQTQFHQASQSQINRKQMHHQQKLQEHGLSSYKKKHFQHGANEAQQIILQRQKQRQQLYQKPELQQQQNRQQHQQQKQQQKQEQQQQVKQSVLKRVSDSKKMPKQKRQPARQQFLQQQRRRQHQQRQLKRQQEQQQIQQQQQVIKPELVQKHQVLRQQQPSAKKRLSESTNMYRQQANQQFIQQKRQQQKQKQKQKQLRQQQNVRKPKHVQQQKPSEIKRLSESKKIPQQYRQQEKQQFFQQQVRKSQVQQQKPSERKRLSEGKNMPMQKRQQARQQFFQQQRQQQQQQSVIKQLSERKNIPTPQRQQSKQHVQQQPLRKPGSSHLSTRRPMKQPNHQLLKTNFIQNGTQQLQLQQQSRQLQLQLQQKQLKLQSQKKQIELLQKKQLLQSKLRRHKIARQSKLIQLSQENKFKERSSKPNIQYPKNIRKMIDNTTETQKHQSATVVGSSQNRLQTTATKSNGRPQIKIEIQNRNQHNIQVNLKQSPKTHLALGQNNIRKPIAFRQQGVAYSKQNSINRPIQLKTKLPSPIITKNSQNGKQRRLGRVLNQGKFSTQTTKNQKIIKLLPNRGNVSRRRKQQVNTRPQLKPLKTNNKAKQTTTLQKNQRTVATRPQYNTRSQISKTKTAAVKEVSKIQPIKGNVAPIQQKKANFSSQIKSKQRLPQVARRKLLVRLNSRNLQQQRLLKTRTKSKSSNRVEQNRNRKIGILRVLKPRPNNRSNTGQLSRSTWTRGIQQPQRGLWGSLPFYAVGRYPSENESTMATGIPEVQIYPSGNDANDIAAVSLGKSTTALPKTPQPLNVVRLTTV
ncbi:hypothetical protein LOTGIDRAFT_231179 [Lottia gigantea]|uniref:Uncharacterized protein n=1 Tax=Lottia gigantea TaxID=225164 RepID=V4CAG7_LOTGI|nr:hypothetical protein LOTGIDRAFT_231179 [Lottia gigantea]ESO98799.1 hypothetical protein LOTGIDRAFT_231179 [Lottia gigantea]